MTSYSYNKPQAFKVTDNGNLQQQTKILRLYGSFHATKFFKSLHDLMKIKHDFIYKKFLAN